MTNTTKKMLLCGLACCWTIASFAQKKISPVDVADLTVRLGAKEVKDMYYSFAAGDKIIIDIKELDQKPIKQVEVMEYPSTVKFADFETSAVAGKQVEVSQKAVYRFRLYNSALVGERVCKVRIQRLPATEKQKNFDTGVIWQTVSDTTYDYNAKDWELRTDTIEKKVLQSIDTTIVSLFDKTERVNSYTAIGGKTMSEIKVKLPANEQDTPLNPYKTKETVSWAYWLCVGQESGKQYAEANKKALSIVSSAAKMAGGYGALAGLAIDGVSYFSMPTVGDNVQYVVLHKKNGKEIVLDEGNGIASQAKMTQPLQGEAIIRLTNDNIRDAIDVQVKAVAVVVTTQYTDVVYTKDVYVPKNAKAKRNPIIQKKQVPIGKE